MARAQITVASAGVVLSLLITIGCGTTPDDSAVESGELVSETVAATPTDVVAANPTEVEEVRGESVEAAQIDTQAFPVVLDVSASADDGASWRFSVTLSSPYDTPERYADAWRVLDGNDVELGIRVLGHDHASEQPFTRSQSGIVIADDVQTVYIEGRDQGNGWSGQRFAFALPR